MARNNRIPNQVGGKGHYDNMSLEPLEVIEAMGEEYLKGFCIGNALKYTMRWESKNGLEDLKKAQWYLNYFTEYLERKDKK
jgi:hypothetical protein